MADGETISDIDFTLVRGGVITGRVTNSEGKPLINERVQFKLADELKNNNSLGLKQIRFTTDDRGIYRIYGIPAGSYLVSAGRPDGQLTLGAGSQFYYPQTFHPNVSDRKEAKAVEAHRAVG